MAVLKCRCGSIDFENGVCLRCRLPIAGETPTHTANLPDVPGEPDSRGSLKFGEVQDPFHGKRGGELCQFLCLEAEYPARMVGTQRAHKRFLITLHLKNNSSCVLDEVGIRMESPEIEFRVANSFVSAEEAIWRNLLPFGSHERQDLDRDAYVTCTTDHDTLAIFNVSVLVDDKRYRLYGRLRFRVEEAALGGEQSINIVSVGENLVGDLSFPSKVQVNRRDKIRLEIPLRLGTSHGSDPTITDPVFCGKSFDLTIMFSNSSEIRYRIHSKPSITLGRSRSRDWLTALLPYDPKDPGDSTNQLSRYHLAVSAVKGKVFVKQMCDPREHRFPLNGSYVNGRPLTEEEEREVWDGDVVNLGGVYPFQVMIPQPTVGRMSWPDAVLFQSNVENAVAPLNHIMLFYSVSIGFGADCLVRLPKEDVGGEHLVLKPTADGVFWSVSPQTEVRSPWGRGFPTDLKYSRFPTDGSEIPLGKCRILWRDAKIKKGKE